MYEFYKKSSKPYQYVEDKKTSSLAGCAAECRNWDWCHSISFKNYSTDIGNCLLHNKKAEALTKIMRTPKKRKDDMVRAKPFSSK